VLADQVLKLATCLRAETEGCVDAYTPRFVDGLLGDLLRELPAVMITGPRACGKTTTAARRSQTIVRLDDPNQAAAFRFAPDAALAGQPEPVLLDEWQEVPEVLGAVKRSVDANGRAGRFLLTGSVRARLTGSQWPGTGRVVPVEMFGLTVAEQRGAQSAGTFVDRLLATEIPFEVPLGDPVDLVGYLDLALRSSFPEALRLSDPARDAWLRGYVDQVVTRDAPEVGGVRSPERLMALLRAVALSSAGTPSETALAQAAGLNVRTVRAYLDLLEDLRIIERTPAWHSSRFTRLVKSPKLYLTDPGLAAAVIGVDRAGLLRSGDLIGRFVETFVASQLRPLLSLTPAAAGLTHLRDRDGAHEVGIVLELRDGGIVAIEVKAAGNVGPGDAKHLRWLRDRAGSQFRRGLVFHTGPAAYHLDDGIVALPVAALWQPV
jgi:predicted AAA+ superfamily ATPase